MSEKIDTGDSATDNIEVHYQALGAGDVAGADGSPKASEKAKTAEAGQSLAGEDDTHSDCTSGAESSEGRSCSTDPEDDRQMWFIQAGCPRIDIDDEYNVLNCVGDEDDVFLQNVLYLARVWVRQLRESRGDVLHNYSLCAALGVSKCTFSATSICQDAVKDEDSVDSAGEEMEAGEHPETGKKSLDEGAAEQDERESRESSKIGNEISVEAVEKDKV